MREWMKRSESDVSSEMQKKRNVVFVKLPHHAIHAFA